MEPIAPLAARMRPRNLDEFLGQKHLVGPGAAFRRLVESDRLGSVLLWGPPGVGKTTLAEIVAHTTGAHFIRVSAVSAGVADLRKAVEEAREARQPSGGLFAPSPRRTILFIDEIHRFNKAQQDAVLPHVESGLLTLIGATTENPSFEVNAALLSRARVYTLNALTDEEIGTAIDAALEDEERGLPGITIDADARQALITLANGDARAALTMLEASASVDAHIDLDTVKSTVQRRVVNYDKSGEQHYDLISALHKCVRDSDPDASLYWLARMLEGGEDPMYLARRIVRMATEDIGLGDPRALQLCVAAQQAVHFIGMPEGGLALAEAIVYLALAPKSNAVYTAYKAAWADVEATRNDPVPLHLRNAPTRLMSELGYGEGYQYAHDAPDAKVDQQHLPDALVGRVYYQPTNRGFERKFRPDEEPLDPQ
jgi:putative ATPase